MNSFFWEVSRHWLFYLRFGFLCTRRRGIFEQFLRNLLTFKLLLFHILPWLLKLPPILLFLLSLTSPIILIQPNILIILINFRLIIQPIYIIRILIKRKISTDTIMLLWINWRLFFKCWMIYCWVYLFFWLF